MNAEKMFFRGFSLTAAIGVVVMYLGLYLTVFQPNILGMLALGIGLGLIYGALVILGLWVLIETPALEKEEV